MRRVFSPFLRWGTLALAAIVGVAGASTLASLHDWVESSPRFCESCHLVAPEIAVWTESAHRSIRCQECHHHTLEDGLRILSNMVTGEGQTGEHGNVHLDSCAGCHTSHDLRWPDIANSVGHRLHTEQAKLECTACHGRQMHFHQPARSICMKCHAGPADGAGHSALHCLACHNFLSQEAVIKPTRQDCLGCHMSLDRPIRIPAKTPMAFSCGACHLPHGDTPLVACEHCHKADLLFGLHKNDGHGACADCHEPHTWRAKRRHCSGCHEGMASHNPGQPCGGCHNFREPAKALQ
jgi:hypothetical protein